MGLLGNGSVLNKDNGFCTSGTGAQSGHAGNFHKNGRYRNRHWFIPKQSSSPEGYQFQSFKLAQKSGGISSINNISGTGTISPLNLAGGLNGVAALTGSGDLAGTTVGLGVITSGLTGSGSTTADITGKLEAAADLTGSGSITTADMIAAIAASADLSGSGSVSAAITGKLEAAADLTGSGSVSASIAGAINASADLTGSGSITSATLNALGQMASDITVGAAVEVLSPSSLAAAVSAIEIETGYDLKEVLRLVSAALAGKLSGGGTSTVTIRDINDTVDRIVATVDASGNRTDVTKDVS
jgi:hypothetical protein